MITPAERDHLIRSRNIKIYTAIITILLNFIFYHSLYLFVLNLFIITVAWQLRNYNLPLSRFMMLNVFITTDLYILYHILNLYNNKLLLITSIIIKQVNESYLRLLVSDIK